MVTLPDEVREHLQLKAGDRVEYLIKPSGNVELRPASTESLFGILHRPGMRAVSIEEMKEGIARFHAEENERIRKGGV